MALLPQLRSLVSAPALSLLFRLHAPTRTKLAAS
jgi:hypothetical protein